MNLDDRAARARDSVRGHVERHLDLPAAQQALRDRGARRRSDQRVARLATATLVVLAAVGGFAALSASQGGGDRPGAVDTDRDRGDVRDREVETDEDGEAGGILETLPASPIDGKDSWRLPVVVDPQTGLQDGQVVTIYGRGFEPGEQVGVVHCSSESDTAGVAIDGCDIGTTANRTTTTASSDGSVVLEFAVSRFITTPYSGDIDCASEAERCLIGVGAMSNYDRSGGAYINFAGAPAFPEPSLALTPNEAIVPGQDVAVSVVGWMPSRAVRIQQCSDDRCEDLVDGRATPEGTFDSVVAVSSEVVDEQGTVPCDAQCTVRAIGIGVEGGSSAPMPAPVSISFDTGAAVTTTLAPTTTTAPPPVTAVPPSTTVPPPDDGRPDPDGAEPGSVGGSGPAATSDDPPGPTTTVTTSPHDGDRGSRT